MNTHPNRYHGALVVLHWLLAVLLIVALQGHMIAGGLILLLTLTRLVVRLKTTHPAPATTGNAP